MAALMRIGANFDTSEFGKRAHMTTIQLPAILDRNATAVLAPQLRLAMQDGEALVLNGDGVTRIGQCGIQLLLSAQRSALTCNTSISITASPVMTAAANLAGLENAVIWTGSNDDR